MVVSMIKDTYLPKHIQSNGVDNLGINCLLSRAKLPLFKIEMMLLFIFSYLKYNSDSFVQPSGSGFCADYQEDKIILND